MRRAWRGGARALGCWRGGHPGTTRGKGDAGLEQGHRQLHPVGCIGDLVAAAACRRRARRTGQARGGRGSAGMREEAHGCGLEAWTNGGAGKGLRASTCSGEDRGSLSFGVVHAREPGGEAAASSGWPGAESEGEFWIEERVASSVDLEDHEEGGSWMASGARVGSLEIRWFV